MKSTTSTFLFLSLLFAHQAFAQSLTVDSRYDNINTSYNDAAKTSGSKDTDVFYGSRLRVLMLGKVNDNLSTKIRLNLLSANDATNSESKYSKYIDYAFINHQVSENFYLNAGKVIALIGGREALVNPGDYYLGSMAGNEILGRPLVGLWPVGATVGYVVEGQKVEMLVANTTNDDTTAQTRTMTGLSYLGSFANKTILPMISYHSDAESENTEKRTYFALGSKFIMNNFDFDFDYLMNQKSYKTWIANSSKELSSIVMSLRYKYSDAFQFVLKGDSSTDKVADVSSTSPTFSDIKYEQVAVGTEFYPYADTKFRYHIALVQKTTKPITGDNSVENKIILGLRLVHDFIK